MKLYSDRQYLPTEFLKTPLLYPFWGADEPRGDYLIENNRFDAYFSKAAEIFEFVQIAESDAVLLPFQWEQIQDYTKVFHDKTHAECAAATTHVKTQVTQLASLALAHQKSLLVFFVHDNDTVSIPIENTIVFRTSLRASKRKVNEFALPGWQSDYIETYYGGNLSLRTKQQRATVSYCGYDNVHKSTKRDKIRHYLGRYPSLSRWAKRVQIDLILHPGSHIRSQALHILSRSKQVEPNFIIRSAFWNGAISRRNIDVELARNSRREYIANLVDGDYVLAARGTGNYSFRFYEALSCGRIPVFINSDCVLPFDQWINWKEYCVWVEEGEIETIADKISAHYAQLSDHQFRELQKECRQLWLKWLSPVGFYSNLYRYFI